MLATNCPCLSCSLPGGVYWIGGVGHSAEDKYLTIADYFLTSYQMCGNVYYLSDLILICDKCIKMADFHKYTEFCRYGAIPEAIYGFHRRDGRSGKSCEQASGEIISILLNKNLNLPSIYFI